MPSNLSPRAQKYFERYAQGVIIRDHTLELYNRFLQNAGEKNSLEKIVNGLLEKKNKVTILDVGCGNAQALFELKQLFKEKIHTIGIDLHTPPTGNLDEFIQGDAHVVPFPQGCDLIVSFRALHEVGDIPTILERIASSLYAEGGRAYLWIRLREEEGETPSYTGEMALADELFLETLSHKEEWNGVHVLVHPVRAPSLSKEGGHTTPMVGAIVLMVRQIK